MTQRTNHSMRKAWGFTLIEVLIATVITLLMMAALAEGFKRLSDGISKGRAKLTLSDRLRSVALVIERDLNGCTVRPVPPMNSTEITGYFEYYDGPMTDNSAGISSLAENRIGDGDDVLMFTARSSGEPFVGKVPYAIMAVAANPAYAPTESDWETLVTISSEYAEIIYFALPTPDPNASANRLQRLANGQSSELYNPLTGLPIVDPADVSGDPVTATASPASYGGGQTRFPQNGYTLYRRVLLIRPDLNIITNGEKHLAIELSGGAARFRGGLNQYLDPLLSSNPIMQDMMRMQIAHQRCDLSLRRVYSTDSRRNFAVAANSLEDLAQPQNRFAHCMLPIPNGASPPIDCTMPLLATTLPYAWSAASVVIDNSGPGNYFVPLSSFSGFLRPEFTLGRMASGNADPFDPANAMLTSDGNADFRSRLGEDILMSGGLAFDIRIYDPTTRIMFNPGPDGMPGNAGIDDDNNGTVDDATESGSAGSDDISLAPGDAGYGFGLGTPIGTTISLSRGSYVDLAHGLRDCYWSSNRIRPPYHVSTAFSGDNPTNSSPFTSGLHHSGCIRYSLNSIPLLYAFQPRYDSWTNIFDIDNFDQSGAMWHGSALRPAPLPQLTPFVPRLSNNSDDVSPSNNAANGIVDDASEVDTLPPFALPLSSIRISIRAEDKGTGSVQQTTVVHEFLSQ